MASIKVHAGDFLKGDGQYGFGVLTLRTNQHNFLGESISINELVLVEVASEESVKKVGGTVGWGLAGGVMFGPAGLLAGILLGGNKKEVTFVAEFKDGRKLFATTDNKTFIELKAAVFKSSNPEKKISNPEIINRLPESSFNSLLPVFGIAVLLLFLTFFINKSNEKQSKNEFAFYSDEKQLYEIVKKIPANQSERNAEGYERLIELNSQKEIYKKKAKHYREVASRKSPVKSSTSSYESKYQRCVKNGIQYFRDIGSYPYLTTGERAEDSAKKKCSHSLMAFPD